MSTITKSLLAILMAVTTITNARPNYVSDPESQIITFNALPPKTIGDAPFTITATADSGLPIIFSSSNSNVATITGNVITVVGVGQTLIIASQAGNGTFAPSSVRQLLTVNNIIQTAQQQGQLWSVTRQGGSGGYGSIIKTNADGTGIVTVKDFNPNSNGFNPSGPLTLASNNKFYGLTSNGGANSTGGVIYEYDPTTEVYSKKFDFSSQTDVFQELTAGSPGKIYGITTFGDFTEIKSSLNGVVIFEFDVLTGVLTPKVTLNDIGFYAVSNMIRSTNGKIYGAVMNTNTGKTFMYEYNPVTNKVISKGQLEDAFLDGRYAAFICFGPNGKIYGTNAYSAKESIFDYDTATNVYTKRVALTNTNPQGFTLADNGKLYGIADNLLIEYDPATQSISKTLTPTINAERAGRFVKTPDGKMYLKFFAGAVNGIYELDPVAFTLTFKLGFATGVQPVISNGGFGLFDGKLYGATLNGGSDDSGVLIQYDYTSNKNTKKYDFTTNPDGINPIGSLTITPDGKLYGMTLTGGAFNKGTIYEYDPATRVFTKRADFDPVITGYNNSSEMLSKTLLPGLNGNLYGTTSSNLFEFNPTTGTVVIKRYSSDWVGNLAQTDDGKIWGLVTLSGTVTLFEYDPIENTYTNKTTLSSQSNGTPTGYLTPSSGNEIYGVITTGGANQSGYIFKYDRANNTVTNVFDFPSSSYTASPLTFANGKLYGTLYAGGSLGNGALFEFDPSTATYTKKIDFDRENKKGAYPSGSLFLAANGKLYGKTSYGGAKDSGVLFEYTPGETTFSIKSEFANTGRADYTSFVQTFQSNKKEQTITFPTVSSKILGTPSFVLKATASSALPVEFTTSSDRAVVSTDTLTMKKAGSVNITASQSGNADYQAATDVIQTICINPAKPVIALSGGNTDNIQLQSSNAESNQWFLNNEKIASATTDKFKPSAAGVYTVQSSVDDCISELSDKFTLVITGDLNTPLSITLYPNPTQETLYVTLPGGSENKVDIVRTDGRSLEQYTTSQSSFEVDVKSYAPGLYLLRVSHSNGSVSVLKFIKQ